eukprot:IDg16949t1
MASAEVGRLNVFYSIVMPIFGVILIIVSFCYGFYCYGENNAVSCVKPSKENESEYEDLAKKRQESIEKVIDEENPDEIMPVYIRPNEQINDR